MTLLPPDASRVTSPQRAPSLDDGPGHELLVGSPYVAYAYGYPHKTAYRALEQPRSLSDVWCDEDRSALALYVHVPFCEMRCGFCNLFTQVRPGDDVQSSYVDVLERQARLVRGALERVGGAAFSCAAIGGGTPTQLAAADLARLLAITERMLGTTIASVPTSVETSPGTATRDRLALLHDHGVQRISIGVQSFFDAECRAVGRPQREGEVASALDQIRAFPFPVLNIDLMYGLPGQTPESLVRSIEIAVGWRADELYLYPLYVRPLTGLSKMSKAWDDERIWLYRCARDRLRAAGYTQVSMRMFRAPRPLGVTGPTYTCQSDGTVGLGCGARSYTQSLHYSEDFAVGATGVREIIASFLQRSDEQLASARYGVALDVAEQRRRHVILSLLSVDGLDENVYRARFEVDATAEFPQIDELVALGLAVRSGGIVRLTEAGLERSDAIGPWLISPPIRQRMAGFSLR